jgi:hypothetical protein
MATRDENIRKAKEGKLQSFSSTASGPKVREQIIDSQMSQLGAAAKKKAEKMLAEPPSYNKGGTVKKTGMALVHKGEKVLTAKQAKKKKC